MFSMTTVLLSTRMPIASAKPPRVIVLSVCPVSLMNSTAVMIDSGIAASTIGERRKLPRNRMMTSAVKPAAMAALSSTLRSAADEQRLVKQRLDVTSCGSSFRVRALRAPR